MKATLAPQTGRAARLPMCLPCDRSKCVLRVVGSVCLARTCLESPRPGRSGLPAHWPRWAHPGCRTDAFPVRTPLPGALLSVDSSVRSRLTDSLQLLPKARCLFVRGRPSGNTACALLPARRWPRQFWRSPRRHGGRHAYFDGRRIVEFREVAYSRRWIPPRVRPGK